MSHGASQENSQVSEDAGLSDLEITSPTPNPTGGRKAPKLGQPLQKRTSTATATANDTSASAQQLTAPAPLPAELAPVVNRGRRIVPVHQSRIQDRPAKVGEKDSSLKIKIELDLEVEVEIYARIKGDVTIGLL
jgi:hypothetical protein